MNQVSKILDLRTQVRFLVPQPVNILLPSTYLRQTLFLLLKSFTLFRFVLIILALKPVENIFSTEVPQFY